MTILKQQSLTRGEIKQLVRLLGKLRWPVPYPVFLAICKSIPIIAIDLALMPDSKHVLLTYRDDDFYKGWHIPGSVLRYDDSIAKAHQRVASSELGVSISNVHFVTYFYLRDHREEGIALLFVAKPKSKPKDGKYFPLTKMPKGFLKAQQPEINYLRKHNL